MTVTVKEKVNQAPEAQDASVDAWWNDTVSFDMDNIISDNETPKSNLSIIVVSWPNHGSLTWNWHTFTYEVTDGSWYSGNDNFTYKVNDWNLDSDVKTVTIVNTEDS